MSKPKHPNELVDRYLQAVRFWLPKTQKQEDLIAELGEDLRSQIEEKETELGRAANVEEASAILKRCGAPMLVAGQLAPRRFLIGPTLFPVYAFVLKMVLFWILVPVFLFIVGPANLANTHSWIAAIGTTLANLWSGLFIAAGVVTLVFGVIERTQAFVEQQHKWDPLRLPPVRPRQTKTSLGKTVCELIFSLFGLTWLLLVPHYPVLILGPAAAFLRGGTLWHTFYLPIVAMSLVAPIRCAIVLAKPHLPSLTLWTQLLQTVLSLVLLHFMFKAVLEMPAANWQPFVAPVSAMSVKYVHIAAIVNASILLSMAATWLGLSIAFVIQLWEFMSYLRRRIVSRQTTASIAA